MQPKNSRATLNALFRPTFITNAVSFSGLSKHLTYPELVLVNSSVWGSLLKRYSKGNYLPREANLDDIRQIPDDFLKISDDMQ